MLIVKPYGRSETARDGEGNLRRQLRLKPGLGDTIGDPLGDVVEFTGSHPELVMAQWISVIDKIAAKPRGRGKPTSGQRRLREELGRAAFDTLMNEVLADCRDRRDEFERLGRLWKSKIHPYGPDDDERRSGREKGRWYARFAGDMEPAAINATEAEKIARKICDHLHGAEYRIAGALPKKRQGQISARAESIAGNVVALDVGADEHPWSSEDRERYAAAGDVAGAIKSAAQERERGADGTGSKRVGPDVAARQLYRHWARLFRDDRGQALSVADARKGMPGLFALHGAVRDAYSRILKRHKKHRRRQGGGSPTISALLPGTMDELYRLVEVKERNRDLNALVRLGKAIHYEAADSGGDEPGSVIDNWPGGVEESRYRDSDGQAEIKRNEAFVRVWRQTIALAARTLKDWADPEDRIQGDILGKIEAAVGEDFDTDAYAAKLPLLFGDRGCLFDESEEDGFRKSVLKLALGGWAGLRNSSFHFKGRRGFTRALIQDYGEQDVRAVRAVMALLHGDAEKRRARMIEVLRAAHVEHYFDQARLDELVGAVAGGGPPQVPLPRFLRVLDRAEKAWRREPYELRLPSPENRQSLQAHPGLLCRYIALKMLYERGFPAWLESRDGNVLNGWIARAVERATEAAVKINRNELAVSRADGLVSLGEGEGIAHFIDRLAAATATEFRVQRGYESDPDRAREQAKYLDDLRCDVVGQAFSAYLADAGLDWTLDDPADGPLPEDNCSDLDRTPAPEQAVIWEASADWEAVLYFLVHLVPVDAIGRLRHQLRKLSILERRPSADIAAVERLLDLYLDMHDAKFDGGEGMAGAEALKHLFETEEAFARACPEQEGLGADRFVPRRGLREILRFGDRKPLMQVFQQYPIETNAVDELIRWETAVDGPPPIAQRQAERERLHEKWLGKKRNFSRDDKALYRVALGDVVEHRHLASRVRLTDHARLHRLLMGVLGRLVDYAGMWERDLYFATLALLRVQGEAPRDVFGEKGIAYLADGQIVQALRTLGRPGGRDACAIFGGLEILFGKGFLDGKTGVVRIRNDLTHFNMLRSGTGLDLTKAVNDTRQLMAYDRKLRNAVSKSVIEALRREALDLTWEMDEHMLANARIKSRQAIHLGDKRITEDLHGYMFVGMVAAVFAGVAIKPGDKREQASGTLSPIKGGEKKREKRPRNRRAGYRSRRSNR